MSCFFFLAELVSFVTVLAYNVLYSLTMLYDYFLWLHYCTYPGPHSVLRVTPRRRSFLCESFSFLLYKEAPYHCCPKGELGHHLHLSYSGPRQSQGIEFLLAPAAHCKWEVSSHLLLRRYLWYDTCHNRENSNAASSLETSLLVDLWWFSQRIVGKYLLDQPLFPPASLCLLDSEDIWVLRSWSLILEQHFL